MTKLRPLNSPLPSTGPRAWWFRYGLRKDLRKLYDNLPEGEFLLDEYQAEALRLWEELRGSESLALYNVARRWRVSAPMSMSISSSHGSAEPKDGWYLTSTFGYVVMTDEKMDSVREQIFQRRITLLGLLFGTSAVVQAVFAVLSYFRPSG